MGKLGQALQVGANLGILVGLVFVYFQIEQNTDILRTEMLQAESQSAIQFEQVMLGELGAEVWAKSLASPEQLSLAEQRIVEAILWSIVEGWRHSFELAQAGLIDDEWRVRVEADVPYYLGNRYGKAWWSVRGDSPDLPVELSNYVTKLVHDIEEGTIDYHSRIMDALE